jgi:hypothetical protein
METPMNLHLNTESDPSPFRFNPFVQLWTGLALILIHPWAASESASSRLFTTASGSSYVVFQSDNTPDNYLSIHFDPATECSATSTVLDYYFGDASDDTDNGWASIDGSVVASAVRIGSDVGPADKVSATLQFDYETLPEGDIGLISVSFAVSSEAIEHLRTGDTTELYYTGADGEWVGRISYPVGNGRSDLTEAIRYCYSKRGPHQLAVELEF